LGSIETRAGRDIDGETPLEFYGMPGHLIRRMHQASQAIFDRAMAEAGFDLTSVQFAALSTIAARPGLDQATLAAAIAFDRPTTGGVIDRLEAKGLVRRKVSAGDRRARELYAEPKGETVLSAVRPIVRKVQKRMLHGLTAQEQATLLRLLAKALDEVGEASRAVGAVSPLRR
jgi:DNA-binding MarR family transcriptional regulator